jgi:hypothetical protein
MWVTDLRDAPGMSSAVRAATEVAEQFGILSTEPVVLQETSNTVVWLRPEPVIAKVGSEPIRRTRSVVSTPWRSNLTLSELKLHGRYKTHGQRHMPILGSSSHSGRGLKERTGPQCHQMNSLDHFADSTSH